MKRPLLWRGILILAVTLICVALAYPPKEKINLGLDLQGGMHLMLQVHTEDALRAETDSDMARLVYMAREEGVTGLKARRTGDSSFVISGAGPDARDKVSSLYERVLRNRWELTRRGDDMVVTMNTQTVNEVSNGAVNQAVQTIRNRVDQFGVAEPVIQPMVTGHRILV